MLRHRKCSVFGKRCCKPGKTLHDGGMIEHPSPNHNERRLGPVQHLILHYTGMPNCEAALQRLCDPSSEVSAHYLVKDNGEVVQMVAEDRRAWHAGKAFWDGIMDINSTSIGIEICNPGHEFGYRAFSHDQILSVMELCQGILSRHKILPHNVLGHSDIAPTRKRDPGEFFPWERLAEQKIGLFPPYNIAGHMADGLPATALRGYGYATDDLTATITAFQRHFRPDKINGEWDDDCGMRLMWLLDQRAVTDIG